jgi:hypothetical protein
MGGGGEGGFGIQALPGRVEANGRLVLLWRQSDQGRNAQNKGRNRAEREAKAREERDASRENGRLGPARGAARPAGQVQ